MFLHFNKERRKAFKKLVKEIDKQSNPYYQEGFEDGFEKGSELLKKSTSKISQEEYNEVMTFLVERNLELHYNLYEQGLELRKRI